jgi:hypothetical protein
VLEHRISSPPAIHSRPITKSSICQSLTFTITYTRPTSPVMSSRPISMAEATTDDESEETGHHAQEPSTYASSACVFDKGQYTFVYTKGALSKRELSSYIRDRLDHGYRSH